MKLFESKNYQTIMFLAISIVLLLIAFSSIKLFENKDFESIKNKIAQEDKNYKITGFATEEPKNKTAEKEQKKNELNKNSEKNKKVEKEEKLYSEKSYNIYYLILAILVICIVVTSLAYFLPFVKNYT